MRGTFKILFCIPFLLGLAFAAVPAQAQPISVLNSATRTVDEMVTDPMFGPSRQILRDARAVLVVPHPLKGGFIFGAEGGDGVLLQRVGRRWSSPAFYTIGSASFGLQIGLEEAHFVMFIMTERALRAVEQSKFTFGGEAGLTVITLGANAQGATSTNLTGDIIVWAASKGAYGGLTLQGSVLAPKADENAQFYGRPVSVPQILADQVSSPAATPLRRALAAI
ncbi:MAG TPA: lipid-binding SYLF domain-containing protein [Rhizomicrobium sp.]|nr:lipid-binding SYLF domain-containing protein [Rhizomicrobium sp.]